MISVFGNGDRKKMVSINQFRKGLLRGLIYRVFFCLVLVALAACGGGGGGEPGPTTPALPEVTLQGVVHKGPVKDAVVTLYEINASGERVYLDEVETDVSGAYSLKVRFSSAKNYALVARGGGYVDAVTGDSVALEDGQQLMAYLSLSDSAPLTRTMNLTPMTTLAGAYTDYLVRGQSMAMSSAIAEGFTVFNGLFNLHNESQSLAIPATGEFLSLDQSTQNLVGLLAGFEQWANDEVSLAPTMSLVAALAQDVREDGIIGNNGNGISSLKLVSAAERFVARITSDETKELVVAADARTLITDLTSASFNIRPVAKDDSAVTIKDEPLVLETAVLLSNDSDAEGGVLSVIRVNQPNVAGSQVTLSNDVITYVPAPEYFGEDSFTYEIADEQGLLAEATVSIVVREAITKPKALDDEFQTSEDVALDIQLSSLLANDIKSIYGDIRFVRLVASPLTVGQVSISGDRVRFSPQADFFGVDQFTYEIEDGRGSLSQAIVSIAVTAVNDLPVAVDDSFSLDEDGVLSTPVSALLANDSDVEGGLVVIGVNATASTRGTVALVDSTVVFSPEANFHGLASYDYVLRDASNAQVSATVSVEVNSVNDLPMTQVDVYTTNEDTAVDIPHTGILSNDVDVDGDVLTVIAVENVQNGSAQMTGSGSILFTPAPDYAGLASFDYLVSDGVAAPVAGRVEISVSPVNDPPDVVADNFSVDEDVVLNIDVASLLINDSDVEDDTLTVVEVVNHALTRGSASLVSGVVTFESELNFNGETSFGYFAEDSEGGRSLGTVNVTINPVNDDPVLSPDSFETTEDTSIDILFASLLSNDTDVEGDVLSVTGVSNPVNGTLDIIDDNTVRFTPAENYFGLAGFDYIVSDGLGGSFTGQVEVMVLAENDAPVAVSDSASTEMYTSVTIDALSNDYDVDGDVITLVSVDSVSANGGRVVTTPEGLFVYQAPAGFIGTDSFSYQVSDTQNVTSNNALVTVDVFSEVGNIAGFSHATCSSEAPSLVPLCIGAIDGVLDGYPNDNAREWASAGESAGAYIQLDWMQEVNIDSITLHDRPNTTDHVTAGVLHFSDGSSINVGALDNGGSAWRVDFDPKLVSWVRFEITETSAATLNTGLMEIIVEGEISPLRKMLNTALYGNLTTSYQNPSLDQVTDGIVNEAGNGWLSTGTGDYVRVDFTQPQTVSKISLRAMISETSQIDGADLTFSDGSSIAIGGLSNLGHLQEFNFEPRQVSWVQFTINSGSGVDLGLSEMAVFSSLGSQNILFYDGFRYSGDLRQWTIVDEGPHNGPSNWRVQQGHVVDTSFILGQTDEGFEIGSYMLSDVVSFDEFDIRVNLLSDKAASPEVDRGAGYIGIIFGYQDNDNYYRLSLSVRKGYRKLEKKVNGVFSELASGTQSFVVGEWSRVRVVKRSGLIVVYVNDVQALAAQDTSFGTGKLGVWLSRAEVSMIDDLTVISAPEHPLLAMTKPYEASVLTTGQLALEFLSSLPVSGVEFVINESLPGEYSEQLLSEPYAATVSLSSPQTLTVTAYLLDDEGERMSHPDAKVVRENIGVQGIHLVAFGDSITEGYRDTDASDDVSLDGRNTSGGYQPVLNNHLSAFFGVPVSIDNEGNPGDMAFEAEVKIQSILARGNGAEGYLLMFGANDSSGSTPVSQADFKQSLRNITLAIVDTGARVWIAKTLERVGRPGQSATIRGYNLRVNELINEFAQTHPGMVSAGPDFYQHFSDNPDGIDTDGIHPNGLGYSRMGQLWSDVLINSL